MTAKKKTATTRKPAPAKAAPVFTPRRVIDRAAVRAAAGEVISAVAKLLHAAGLDYTMATLVVCERGGRDESEIDVTPAQRGTGPLAHLLADDEADASD